MVCRKGSQNKTLLITALLLNIVHGKSFEAMKAPVIVIALKEITSRFLKCIKAISVYRKGSQNKIIIIGTQCAPHRAKMGYLLEANYVCPNQ